MLQFSLPSESNREDVLAFYQEFEEDGGSCIGFAHRKNYDLWLREMRNRAAGENLPEGYVRENFYLVYEGPVLVGVFSLKFELTQYLLDFGGHVGYAVRPSRRNRGLATQILRQGLEIARNFGFTKILAVCNEDNFPSEKVILKNGGVLENTRYDAEENVNVNRYWIAL